MELNVILTFTVPPGEPDPPDRVSDGCAALHTAAAASQIEENFAKIRPQKNRSDRFIFTLPVWCLFPF